MSRGSTVSLARQNQCPLPSEATRLTSRYRPPTIMPGFSGDSAAPIAWVAALSGLPWGAAVGLPLVVLSRVLVDDASSASAGRFTSSRWTSVVASGSSAVGVCWAAEPPLRLSDTGSDTCSLLIDDGPGTVGRVTSADGSPEDR